MTKQEFLSLYGGTDVKAAGILAAQRIARGAMEALAGYLRPGLTRDEVHDYAAQVMTEAGSEGWWIHGDAALVLFGPLTTFSAHEDPAPLFAGKVIGENDIVTVDVAPTVGGGWGDLTRAFFFEDGALTDWRRAKNAAWREGMAFEEELHAAALDFVDARTTFAELHAFLSEKLAQRGYRNCDYHDNFGHTVENDQKDRVTIAAGENRCIAQYGKPLTLEPHICRIGGSFGFKHENMYAFQNGRLREVP